MSAEIVFYDPSGDSISPAAAFDGKELIASIAQAGYLTWTSTVV